MFARELNDAVRETMSPYLQTIENLIVRSENRVDKVNEMVCNLIEIERNHCRTMEHATDCLERTIATYQREIEKMRELRNLQEKTLYEQQNELRRGQSEVERLIKANAEMIATQQLLVNQISKTTINAHKTN